MIVEMTTDHIGKINKNFADQGWDERSDILNTYLQEQNKGDRIVLVYEKDDQVMGYITLVINPSSGPFKNTKIPEIKDFNVFEKYQNKGIGQELLDAIILEVNGPQVGIGVGLNPDYGKAVRMYIKNGFIPDGKGIYYKGEIVKAGDTCINDDDLTMYFTKGVCDV